MAYRHVTLMSEHKGGTTIEEIVQKSAIRRAIESMERDTNGILTSDENKIAVANAIQQKKLLNNLEYQKRNEKIKGNTLTDFGYKKQSKEEKEYLMRKNSQQPMGSKHQTKKRKIIIANQLLFPQMGKKSYNYLYVESKTQPLSSMLIDCCEQDPSLKAPMSMSLKSNLMQPPKNSKQKVSSDYSSQKQSIKQQAQQVSKGPQQNQSQKRFFKSARDKEKTVISIHNIDKMVNLDDKSPPISFFNSKKPRSITIDVSRTDRVSSITANTDVNEEARPGKVFHKLKKEKNKLKTISNIPDFIKPSIDLHQQSKGKNLSRPEMKGESQQVLEAEKLKIKTQQCQEGNPSSSLEPSPNNIIGQKIVFAKHILKSKIQTIESKSSSSDLHSIINNEVRTEARSKARSRQRVTKQAETNIEICGWDEDQQRQQPDYIQ